MKKLTQKKTAFYLLWKEHLARPGEYLPAWRFVGEIFLAELGDYFFMSYKGPTNGLAVYFDEMDVVDRQMITGKTGAKYYEYRIKPEATVEQIKDDELREIAILITAHHNNEVTII